MKIAASRSELPKNPAIVPDFFYAAGDAILTAV